MDTDTITIGVAIEDVAESFGIAVEIRNYRLFLSKELFEISLFKAVVGSANGAVGKCSDVDEAEFLVWEILLEGLKGEDRLAGWDVAHADKDVVGLARIGNEVENAGAAFGELRVCLV